VRECLDKAYASRFRQALQVHIRVQLLSARVRVQVSNKPIMPPELKPFLICEKLFY
jgi:hypothetical protein